jgi:CBS domain containing-hemolysin-like protein
MLLSLLAVLVLLFLSAFFSGSETALFSLTPGQRVELKARQPGLSRRVEQLLARPDQLLGTLLLGNLIANTSATAVLTLVAVGLAQRAGASEAAYLAGGGFVMTVVVIVFGEVMPKVAAGRAPVRYVRLAAPLVLGCRAALAPVVALLTRVSAVITPRGHESEALSDEELQTMVEVGRERGVVRGPEVDVLLNLIGLERRTVAEVMTPRIDIMAVPDTVTVGEAIKRARELGFSRLPVFHGSKDTIVGTLHIKELLAAPHPDAPALPLARPPFFVPEVKRLAELLDELRRKGTHVAVVVDEFGQTAGLVTLEDLLEAVFGEITDEFDVAEELPYTKVDERSYLVDGEIDLATLNRLFPGAFRGTGHDRLAGFIHDRLGRLPRTGDRLSVRDIEITVSETDGNKLEKVLVSRGDRT